MKKDLQNEFLSTITHEIRTPLTSIKGFSQTLQDNWDKINDEQKKKFIKIIEEQSERLIKLIENVLNVAKIDSDGENIVLKKVNLNQVVKKAIELTKINHKGHFFETNFTGGELLTLADTDFCEQILLNILENACKYSPKNSTVKISTGTKENNVFVEIADQGEGIEKNQLPKIFDKFYRADNYLTSKTQGSGLGLYIAQNLAQKMNGKIEVKSPAENGTGTSFALYLPLFEIEDFTRRDMWCTALLALLFQKEKSSP